MVWSRAGGLLAAVQLKSRAVLLRASCRFANGVWMCGKDMWCGGWKGQLKVGEAGSRLGVAGPALTACDCFCR